MRIMKSGENKSCNVALDKEKGKVKMKKFRALVTIILEHLPEVHCDIFHIYHMTSLFTPYEII